MYFILLPFLILKRHKENYFKWLIQFFRKQYDIRCYSIDEQVFIPYNNAINKEKYYNAIHNILLKPINFNKKDILVYITKEQALVEIDFNYANCALITNCFPKNNNQTKKEIFNYFIMECNLKRNEEIEKALRKVKREDILEIFDKIELYSKISNKLNDDKPISKKLKI